MTPLQALCVSLALLASATVGAAPPPPAAPTMVVQLGHPEGVRAIAFSADGRQFVTGGGTRMKLWDTQSGRELRSFVGHDEAVVAVAFAPDGRRAISGSHDGTARLWELETGRQLRVFRVEHSWIHGVAISPDGANALIAGSDGTVRRWELASGKERGRFRHHGDGTVNGVRYSPDGALAISASDDDTAVLFDPQKGTIRRRFTMRNSVKAAAFSPDGATVATGSSVDGLVTLWSVATGAPISQHDATGTGNVADLAFRPDGAALLVGHDWSSGLLTLATGKTVPIAGVGGAFSPDGRSLVTSAEGLRFFDGRTGAPERTLPTRGSAVRSLRFAPDGESFFAGLGSGAIAHWSVPEARLLRVLHGHDRSASSRKGTAVLALDVSDDGRTLLSGALDGTVRRFELPSGKELGSLPKQERLQVVALAPDGTQLVAVERAILRAPAKGGPLALAVGAFGMTSILSGAFSRDADHFFDGHTLYDVEKGRVVAHARGHTSYVLAGDVSPDGTRLLSGSDDRTVRHWSVEDGDEARALKTLRGHTSAVEAVALSPDGQTALSGSFDHTMRLWDLRTGRALAVFGGHTDRVTTVAFSPDGRLALSGSYDGSARLWDLTTKQLLFIAVAGDGEQWLAMGPDGSWDASARGGELVAMVRGLQAPWRIDQFATSANRPDRILRAIPGADPALIAHLERLHQKRLRRLGLADRATPLDGHAPTATILGLEPTGRTASLTFTCADARTPLHGAAVFVNDVPVPGASAAPTGAASTTTIPLALSNGRNTVEVSCTNALGVESPRASSFVDVADVGPAELYVVALGVSTYRALDPLRFAHQDALDLERAMTSMPGFRAIHRLTFVNDAVDRRALEQARALLARARVDDTVVLFVAGHGMHDLDADATWYFLPSTADPTRLAETALPFEEVEGLLSGIAPRRKLFLVDACESGELEPEEVAAPLRARAGRIPRGFVRPGASRADAPAVRAPSRPWLRERDRFVGNDLRRRTGAVVFSSSAGNERSWESAEAGNGLFTEALLTAIGGAADDDHDGAVDTDELRRFVTAEVARVTEGEQHPTVDRDNLTQRIALPVRAAPASR